MKPEVLFGKGLISSLEDSETVKVDVSASKLSEELDTAEKDQKEINKEHAQEEKSSDVENNANMDEISTKTKETVEVSIGNEDLDNIETPLIAPEQTEQTQEVETSTTPEFVEGETPTEVTAEEEIAPEVTEEHAEEAIQALESLKEVISPNLNALRDHHNFIRSTMGLKPSMFYSPEGLTETQNIIRASLNGRHSIESLVEKGPNYTELERYAVSTEGIQEAITAMGALSRCEALAGVKVNNENRKVLAVAIESISEDLGMQVSMEDGEEAVNPSMIQRVKETLKKWWEAFKSAMKKFGNWASSVFKRMNILKNLDNLEGKITFKKARAFETVITGGVLDFTELAKRIGADGAELNEIQRYFESSEQFVVRRTGDSYEDSKGNKHENFTVEIKTEVFLDPNLKRIAESGFDLDEIDKYVADLSQRMKSHQRYIKSATSPNASSDSGHGFISGKFIKEAYQQTNAFSEEDRVYLISDKQHYSAQFGYMAVNRDTDLTMMIGLTSFEQLGSEEKREMDMDLKNFHIVDILNKVTKVFRQNYQLFQQSLDLSIANELKLDIDNTKTQRAITTQISTWQAMVQSDIRIMFKLAGLISTIQAHFQGKPVK